VQAFRVEPPTPVTVNSKVVVVESSPVLRGVPLVTAPTPWSMVPAPWSKTAVSVVALPAVMGDWVAVKLEIVGAGVGIGAGLSPPPPPPQSVVPRRARTAATARKKAFRPVDLPKGLRNGIKPLVECIPIEVLIDYHGVVW
jgi:hypothetical protein